MSKRFVPYESAFYLGPFVLLTIVIWDYFGWKWGILLAGCTFGFAYFLDWYMTKPLGKPPDESSPKGQP